MVWNVSQRGSVNIVDTERIINDQSALDKLSEESIFLSDLVMDENMTYDSTLTITGNSRTNFTQIQCAPASAFINNIDFTGKPMAFLRVLGKKHSN